MQLSPYQFTVKHISGPDNFAADHMSRCSLWDKIIREAMLRAKNGREEVELESFDRLREEVWAKLEQLERAEDDLKDDESGGGDDDSFDSDLHLSQRGGGSPVIKVAETVEETKFEDDAMMKQIQKHKSLVAASRGKQSEDRDERISISKFFELNTKAHSKARVFAVNAMSMDLTELMSNVSSDELHHHRRQSHHSGRFQASQSKKTGAFSCHCC